MAQPVIQHSFNSGEWAPALNARVDLSKYHNAAALLRNFFVDYRGGASTRTGTKYIIQAYNSNLAVRLIPFQASFSVNYVLEFGNRYIRFINNGAPVLETSFAITGATQANPAVITVVGNNYAVGDWIFITGVLGMTQLNGKYYRVGSVAGNLVGLQTLNGVAINSTGYGAYTSGGTVARIYQIPSPYESADLATLKYAQNVNTLVLTHKSYVPYILTLISANNWTLNTILFGATINPPTGVGATTTLAAGNVNYAYVVTSVDAGGQESGPSAVATLSAKQDLRAVAGTNTISWTAKTGAKFYNVYKSELSYAGAVPSGAAFGFIGFTTGTSLIDSNIAPNFDETPPIATNPFQGAGIASITVTAPGVYTVVPALVVDNAPVGGQTATANAILQVQGTPTVSFGGNLYQVGDIIVGSNGVACVVATVGATDITSVRPITFTGSNPGSVAGAGNSTPANPVTFTNPHGGLQAQLNLVWGVGIAQVTSPGAGYITAPNVTPSAGAATFIATLGPTSSGNPSVPGYFQQRLVLAGPTQNPQQFDMSKPGAYFNFDVSNPVQPDDAIEGTIVSGQLNSIKSLVSMPSGLILFSDRAAWQVNGGSPGSAITPIDATAQSQAYNGASDVPPIVATFDILFVQAKGSVIRDVAYDFYRNIYTGTDISVLSSHLFYGYTITGWSFAEEPFKIVWAIRNDGTLLSLTFLKEQELIGWSHSDTAGLFKSVCCITETSSLGSFDATYVVVQRVINGLTLQYIERFAERIFPNGVTDAWCVDAGLQYSGAPTNSFSGGEHLAGATVTGLADGLVITPFVMPISGNFTLPTAASKVTVGLAFTPQLQTMQLDLSEPTVQGKRKKITAVTVRCENTLGLSIGATFSTLVPMKDLVVGNVGSASNQVVAGLVTADARTIIDPSYTVPGQYCIQQSFPFPATVLGVIPEVVVGDTK